MDHSQLLVELNLLLVDVLDGLMNVLELLLLLAAMRRGARPVSNCEASERQSRERTESEPKRRG